MPVSKQAKKRLRSNERKAELNNAILARLKTLKKKFVKMTNKEEAEKAARELQREYDKAVTKNAIPKGRADRNKARIALQLKKLS